MHGDLGRTPCPPGGLFAEYLRRQQNPHLTDQERICDNEIRQRGIPARIAIARSAGFWNRGHLEKWIEAARTHILTTGRKESS